jgi:hypothetical protein
MKPYKKVGNYLRAATDLVTLRGDNPIFSSEEIDSIMIGLFPQIESYLQGYIPGSRLTRDYDLAPNGYWVNVYATVGNKGGLINLIVDANKRTIETSVKIIHGEISAINMHEIAIMITDGSLPYQLK